MRRRLLLLAALVSGVAAQGQATPHNERLDRMVALVLPVARDASAKLDSVERLARRDSGTARADSTVYRFWRSNQDIRLRLNRADAIEFEIAIYPDGATAQMMARGRIGEAPPPIADSLIRLIGAHGILARLGEGDMYYQYSAAGLRRRIACCVSPGMSDYLGMVVMEQERQSAADGGLMVPLNEIIVRLARAEQFLATNTSSPAFSEVEYNRNRYLAWILYGIDNSPAFHYSTKELIPDFRRAMETLASQRAKEHSGKAAQAMLDVLKRNGYKRTPEVDAYIRNGWDELSRQTRRELRPPQ